MSLLSSFYRSQNEKYVVYHSAILTFIITILIPMNFGVTKLPLPVTLLLFSFGFSSLFMIIHNDQVGQSILRSLRINSKRSKNATIWPKEFKMNQEVVIQPQRFPSISDADTSDEIQEPIPLLRNYVEKIMVMHNSNMDKDTQDSFSKLDGWLSKFSNVEMQKD